MKKNIILIGMPGSGKTEISKRLARILCREPADCDQLTENAEKMSIAEIFRTKGEEYFRTAETDILSRLSGSENMVISSGGGSVLRNFDLIKDNFFVVYLRRSLDKIALNLTAGTRPLSKNEDELRNLYEHRHILYENACDVTVENEGTEEAAAMEAALKFMSYCAASVQGGAADEKKSRHLLAVIGSPVSHSLSPEIHSIFARSSGLDCLYMPLDVTKDNLADFINCAKNAGIRGFNITMPLKEEIFEYLDCISEDAKLAGAVNTAVIEDGMILGFNTDGIGFVMSLGKQTAGMTSPKALILGAGGAAKAAACSLNARGWDVTVCSRHPETVTVPSSAVRCIHWDSTADESSHADLIINATPLGMNGKDEDFSDFAFIDNAKEGCVVYDLIYSPPETALLKYAAKRKMKTYNGLMMLVFQAAFAFELFTGHLPSMESIEKAAEHLKSR